MALERRRAPRPPLVAAVEAIESQGASHLRARISDLSLVGCYLETIDPLPAGTEIRLNINHSDADFSALGIVAHSKPNVGMAIRFTDVQLDQNAILERLLVELVHW